MDHISPSHEKVPISPKTGQSRESGNAGQLPRAPVIILQREWLHAESHQELGKLGTWEDPEGVMIKQGKAGTKGWRLSTDLRPYGYSEERRDKKQGLQSAHWAEARTPSTGRVHAFQVQLLAGESTHKQH